MLAVLRGERSEADAARAYGVDEATVRAWVRTALGGAERALAAEAGREGQVGPWRLALASLGVGLVWLLLRIVYWNGYYTEDSPGYVTEAIQTFVGGFVARPHVNGMNIGTYVPVVLPLALLGKSEVALSVWPMFCSLLGVVSIGLLCGRLVGRPWGVLAALLYATYPGDVFFSTVVMPDAIQAGWLTFSIALVFHALGTPAQPHRPMLVAAGVALGVCHLVRANDVLLLPAGVAVVAWLSAAGRTRIANVSSLVAGWGAVVLAESVLYAITAGDPLLRVKVVAGHYGPLDSVTRWGLNHNTLTLPYSLFPPLLWWRIGGWGRLNLDQAYHGGVFVVTAFALAGAALTLLRRRTLPPRWLVALVAWVAWPLLYHQFGTQSLAAYVPIHRLSRHFVVYAPGAIATLVAATAVVARQWPVTSDFGRVCARSAGGVALALLLLTNWQGIGIAHEAYYDIKSTYARIRASLPPGTTTLVGDPGDLCYFDFWLNPMRDPRVTLVPFENVASCDAVPEGVVLTHANPGWRGLAAVTIRTAVERLPCLVDPPRHWRSLYDGRRERVYAVGGVTDVEPTR